MNRLFVLSVPDNTVKTVYTEHIIASVEIKDCNIIIDEQNIFDQPVKNNIRTYYNISKITTGQRDDHTTDCLIFYQTFQWIL